MNSPSLRTVHLKNNILVNIPDLPDELQSYVISFNPIKQTSMLKNSMQFKNLIVFDMHNTSSSIVFSENSNKYEHLERIDIGFNVRLLIEIF